MDGVGEGCRGGEPDMGWGTGGGGERKRDSKGEFFERVLVIVIRI